MAGDPLQVGVNDELVLDAGPVRRSRGRRARND